MQKLRNRVRYLADILLVQQLVSFVFSFSVIRFGFPFFPWC
jgi:hypothetical protein